jgi:putative membrane protein
MQGLVVRWLVSALALYLTDLIVAGVNIDTITALLFAAVTIGVLNAVVRPIILLLTLPLNILTLGLFTLVVNGLMLKIASEVVNGFHVNGFWSAVGGALLMSFFSFFINLLIGDTGKVEVVRIRTLSFRH